MLLRSGYSTALESLRLIVAFVVGLQRSLLDPQRSYSCLTVIIGAVQAAGLSIAQPAIYASMLELLCVIAMDPYTGGSLLYLLRQQQIFASQLDLVACSPLPAEVTCPLFLHEYPFS